MSTEEVYSATVLPAGRPKKKSWHRGRKASAISASLSKLGPNLKSLDDPERQLHGHVLMDEVSGMDILEFSTRVLGISFADRPAQELVLRLMYGLPIPAGVVSVPVERETSDGSFVLELEEMTWDSLRVLLTGDVEEFEAGVEKSEFVGCIGRRGGKSFTSSVMVVYEATRAGWRGHLNEDEIAWALITATRQEQAENVLLDTCYNLLNRSKLRFKYIIEEKTRSILTLRNGYKIAAYPCSSSAGLGLAAFIHAFDEFAYYGVTGPKSDKKIHDALTPAQMQFSSSNPKTLFISTPAGKQGMFWELCSGRRVPGRLLIRAPSWVMNPPAAYGDPKYKFLRRKHRLDPAMFDIWYRGNFAEMMDAFYEPQDVDDACVLGGDLPYHGGFFYMWGADQSGLTGNDRFSFTVVHKDPARGKIVVDCVRSWSSQDGDEIMANIAGLQKKYHLCSGMIDRYASGWVASSMEKIKLLIDIRPSLANAHNNFKTLLIAGKVELPRRPSLVEALKRTQAYYSRSNTLSIGHERTAKGHGDEADSVATAVMALSRAGWIPPARSKEQEYEDKEHLRRQREYDPMTFAL